MTCSLHRASEAEIERLLAAPDAVTAFLYPGHASAPPTRKALPKGMLGWLLRLTPISIEEAAPVPDGSTAAGAPDPDRSVEIDQSWHGLHFLLTGTADQGDEPACYFMQGGENLDDDGYARALRPDQVRRFAAYLDAFTPAELIRRYDPARMTKLDIYPKAIWNRAAAPGESALEWLLGNYTQAQRFVQKAAAAGDGLIVNIS